MKKFISLLLVVLILLLSGCSRIPDAHGAPQQLSDTPDSLLVLPSFYNYDEYLEYIKTLDFSYGFAEWRDVDFVGEWVRFKLQSIPTMPITHYSYWFNDAYIKGHYFLAISHVKKPFETDEAPEAKPVNISSDMTSMRQLTDVKENGLYKIVRNGVQYDYFRKGVLLSISWIKNGVEYEIYADELYEYPEEAKDTFIARLLSVDDAEFKLALAEINPDPMTN